MLAEIIPKVAQDERGEKSSSYTPRPSSAGPEKCIRALVYHALETPQKPLPGRAALIFNDSGWHEELTNDWINKTAYRIHSSQMEISIPGALPWLEGQSRFCGVCKKDGKDATHPAEDIHGHIDGIITDLIGVDRLYEHKALNHSSFNRIWAGAWPLDYLTQVAFYIAGVQRVNPEINEGLLLIKNKNTAAYLELRVRYDKDEDRLFILEMVRSDGDRDEPEFFMECVIQSALEKFEKVEEFRAAGNLPERPFAFGTEFPCGYCQYAATCWENYEAEVSGFQRNKVLDDEETRLAIRYFETGRGIAVMEKEKEKLKETLKAALLKKEIRSGYAGKYIVTIDMQERTVINPEATAEAIAAATIKSKSEVLRVRLQKENSNGINGNQKAHEDRWLKRRAAAAASRRNSLGDQGNEM